MLPTNKKGELGSKNGGRSLVNVRMGKGLLSRPNLKKKVQNNAFPKGWPPSQRMQFALRFDPNPLIHCLHHPAVRVLILKSIIWLPYIFVVGKWNLKANAIQKHLAAKENQNQVKITQLPNLQAKKPCQ